MPGSNGPASVVGSSIAIAVLSGAVVYVDEMMRLRTIKIMLQVVGARAYCWVCVQMKPLVISQLLTNGYAFDSVTDHLAKTPNWKSIVLVEPIGS